MRIRNHALAGIVMATLLVAPGCVKLWQKNLDIKTYMVQVERPGSPNAYTQKGKLWIDDVAVLPPYNARNLVLRKSDVEYDASYYSELLIPPADNFRNAIYEWFAASHLFTESTLAERSRMSYRLAATVMRFYGDLEAGQAVLQLKISLIDEQTKSSAVVLLNKDYEQRVAVEEFSADDLIRAYDKALSLILAACETDIVDTLETLMD